MDATLRNSHFRFPNSPFPIDTRFRYLARTTDMIGTILNAAGIVVGSLAGLTLSKQPSVAAQVGLKSALGAVTVWVGLRTTWMHLGDGLAGMIRGLTIVIVAMMLGQFVGRLLRLQKTLNKLGRFAKERLAAPGTTPGKRFNDGFITGALLFSLNPMATLGAIEDGLAQHWATLGIKAVLDGLTAMAFVSTFGWGVILTVIPLVAFQGTLTLGCRLLAPFLEAHALLDPIHATCGLLIFCLALIVLEIKKVEVANYLPSLIIAPAIASVWR